MNREREQQYGIKLMDALLSGSFVPGVIYGGILANLFASDINQAKGYGEFKGYTPSNAFEGDMFVEPWRETVRGVAGMEPSDSAKMDSALARGDFQDALRYIQPAMMDWLHPVEKFQTDSLFDILGIKKPKALDYLMGVF